mgnify:CR=1 FL=1
MTNQILRSGLSLLGLALLLQSCGGGATSSLEPDAPQFNLLSSAETGIDFENKIVETPELNLGFYDYFYNGSGLAAGDLDNDGRTDLFFCGNHAGNKLYFNEGNWKFREATLESGIDSKDKWSTGATLVDINNDGWLDIYVSNSGPTNDRKRLANQLYINNQDGTFSENAAAYGIADDGRTTQSTFFDMDNDGDLDLFVMNHSLRNREKDAIKWGTNFASLDPEVQKQDINTLYRNDGNNTFTDITRQAGIYQPGFGLGLSVSDFDDNGYLDIYVANDYFIPDFFYLNNGNGTFTDKVKSKSSHVSFYSMGCDAADINNDGLVDLAVVDMTPADHFRNKTLMASMNVRQFTWLKEQMGYAPQYMFNTLQLNRGYGVYSEIGLMAGVSQTDWSWAALLADFDNDGWKDFMVTNGYWRDTKDNDWRIRLHDRYAEKGESPEVYFEHLQTANSTPLPNYLFRNKGDLTFENVSDAWSFGEPSFSHGAVYADLDEDGDLDIVTNNLGSKAFVLRNNAREKGQGNFIRFKLTAGENFNTCLNSKVKIFYGDAQQLFEYSFTRGYESFVEPVAHFGLGDVNKIDRAEIHWPDGRVTTLQQPAINKVHEVAKEEVKRLAKAPKKNRQIFMDISKQQPGIDFRHQENRYEDFLMEVLLPHRQSTLGPCLAVSDVNGDGIDDFYTGGAKGQPGVLYIQAASMAFQPAPQTAFAQDAGSEDLGALFFDADQDGDQDLYVASGGGGAFEAGSDLLQDRLYLNDGQGNFTKASGVLPKIGSSTATVAASDWDQDGDLDLLVGGRTQPRKYPHPPQSYLMQNDGGRFTDVTDQLYPELKRIGMITDASWTDVNGDGWEDLMIVGEWMPITLLLNREGELSPLPVLENQGIRGWWYSIEPGDFDGDGDPDFLVGNIGLNNKFHPSQEKNLHVFCNDFDDNGTPDIVLSKHYKGDIVPVRGKECSTVQMPFLAEKFESYASFASSSLEDIYGADKLEEALHLQADNFASVYLENTGGGQFAMHALPNAAQIAPINSIVVQDFNQDGKLDAIVGGNMIETEVETPAYDAGKGLFMAGNGDGTFEASLYMPESGLFCPFNVKDIALFKLKGQRPGLIVANNDGPLQMYAWIGDQTAQ